MHSHSDSVRVLKNEFLRFETPLRIEVFKIPPKGAEKINAEEILNGLLITYFSLLIPSRCEWIRKTLVGSFDVRHTAGNRI